MVENEQNIGLDSKYEISLSEEQKNELQTQIYMNEYFSKKDINTKKFYQLGVYNSTNVDKVLVNIFNPQPKTITFRNINVFYPQPIYITLEIPDLYIPLCWFDEVGQQNYICRHKITLNTLNQLKIQTTGGKKTRNHRSKKARKTKKCF